MGPLNDPSSCFEAGVFLAFNFFGAARFHMRLVVPAFEKLANRFGVVTFVEAYVLAAGSRLRTADWHAIEGGFKKFDIVSVSTTDHHPKRNASSVSQHRSLGSQLAAIGRIFACIFPHPEATWSSLRQHFANSTECF